MQERSGTGLAKWHPIPTSSGNAALAIHHLGDLIPEFVQLDILMGLLLHPLVGFFEPLVRRLMFPFLEVSPGQIQPVKGLALRSLLFGAERRLIALPTALLPCPESPSCGSKTSEDDGWAYHCRANRAVRP